jgi:hypothetical protein
LILGRIMCEIYYWYKKRRFKRIIYKNDNLEAMEKSSKAMDIIEEQTKYVPKHIPDGYKLK